MKTVNAIYPIQVSILVAAMLLAACKPANPGYDNGAKTSDPVATTPLAPYVPPPIDPSLVPTRTIDINVDQAMKFSVAEITAQPGEVLKITLHNVGTLPKSTMGHNFVLLDKIANMQDYDNAAVGCAATDYFPPKYESWVIARIRLLGGGESDSTVFAVPNVTGTYHYLCSFPGHMPNGATGILRVQN
ncbi:MAG TPA: plastocyanin/azurin family copper-binding protein [Opitutales bacterium]|jgi:azurin|nr:plastocyanin/azurin family copper-binding protein [Opitutales bacterium]